MWILLLPGGLVIVLFVVVLNRRIKQMGNRLEDCENRLRNLAVIGDQFPRYLKEGQVIADRLACDLKVNQQRLQKLIQEAGRSSDYLEYLEGKKEKKNTEFNREKIASILILVNQGFSPREISERLNLSIGEVELVVNLRKYSREQEERL